MKSKTANGPAKATENLLDELQSTLSHGTVARRVEALRRVTELFVASAIDNSDDLIALFDDVFQCQIDNIEMSARASLADRLAPIDTAPPRIIRTLALDDVIEVAGPVLSKSERLDEVTLIEIARSKSQAHLQAISMRRVLSDALTDVLVTRGNDAVVRSTVSNPGAKFSEGGYAQLVERAERDDDIATCVGLRPDLPHHHYLKLVVKASLNVRKKLQAANPGMADAVAGAVQEASQRIRAAATSERTEMARALVRSLFEDGRLDEHQVAIFAEQDKFDETNAALAALAGIAVTTAEDMMIEKRNEGVMILAKVAAISWSTVRAIIGMRDKLSGSEPTDLTSARETYERLRGSTAQQVLRFHRMQQGASSVPA